MPSNPLTRAELDAARALADAATSGPWETFHGLNIRGAGRRLVANCGGHSQNFDVEKNAQENAANAALVIASRDLVPRLVAEVLRLRERWATSALAHHRWAMRKDDAPEVGCFCHDCAEARAILAEGE